jgi:hypothetical protein
MFVAEGVVMATMHPGIAAGSVTLAGIVLFKSNTPFATCLLCGAILNQLQQFALIMVGSCVSVLCTNLFAILVKTLLSV